MSRIGKKPIPLPKGVEVKLTGGLVEVKGPKGQLAQSLPPGVSMVLEDGQIVTSVADDRTQAAMCTSRSDTRIRWCSRCRRASTSPSTSRRT
jgi:ribosomal protein L6P/L9E